jgi:hypothetical protein
VSNLPSDVSSNSPSLSPLRLTEWTSCGGCAAKWGATLALFITINIGIGGFFSWILVGFILFPFLIIIFELPENHPHFQVEDSSQGALNDGK